MLKSVTALSASLIIAQVISILNQLIIGRYYSPDLLGAYSIAIQIGSFFSIFLFLRSEYFVVEIEKSKVAKYFMNYTFVTRLPYGLLAVVGVLAANLIYPFSTYDSIVFAVAFGVLTSYNTGLQQILFKQRRYFQSGLTEVVQKSFYGALLIAFYLLEFNLINEIMLAFFIAIGLRYAYTHFKLKSGLKVVLAKKEGLLKNSWGLLEKGKTLSKNNVVSALATLIPTVYITKEFSLADLGLFSMAVTILSMPTTLVGNAVSNVLYERLSSKDSHSIGRKQILGLLFFLVLSSAAFLLILPFGRPIVGYLFDQTWADSVRFAQYLLPAMMISYISKPFERMCYIYNRASWHFTTIKIRLVLALLAIVIFHFSPLNTVIEYIILHSIGQLVHYMIDLSYNLRILKYDGKKI